MNLIIPCLLATFCLNIVRCSNNMGILSDKSKIQHLWSFKTLKKFGTNIYNSLKESEMVSAKGHKGELIWLVADETDQEKKYNGITSEFE